MVRKILTMILAGNKANAFRRLTIPQKQFIHCVKSVQIWSLVWSVLSRIWKFIFFSLFQIGTGKTKTY